MRLMTLCHNETLDWVDSATDRPRNGGLNAFGRAVVHELNRLGVIVDCSHVSAEGARAAIAASRAPIALTHSNSFSLCDHPRNAPDDVLRSIGETGGLVLATFVPAFLSQARRNWQARARGGHDGAPAVSDPKEQFEQQQAQAGMAPRTTLAMVVDHIERLIDLAGADHVGIGSDFFGGPQPDGLEDVSRFPNLISECLRRKFSKRTIEGLASAKHARLHAPRGARRRQAAQDRKAESRKAGGLSRSLAAMPTQIKAVAFDLDGTLIRGPEALPGGGRSGRGASERRIENRLLHAGFSAPPGRDREKAVQPRLRRRARRRDFGGLVGGGEPCRANINGGASLCSPAMACATLSSGSAPA